MRDVFYTILVVWIIWRILQSINVHKTRQTNNTQHSSRQGETKINYVPPSKKKIDDDEGEYVDYEEIK